MFWLNVYYIRVKRGFYPSPKHYILEGIGQRQVSLGLDVDDGTDIFFYMLIQELITFQAEDTGPKGLQWIL